MLFVRGEYLFDNTSFFFETNSNVAKETRGNDGDLLKEWWENQNDMNEDLVTRCQVRVKAIIDEFINEGFEKKAIAEVFADLQEAKVIYDMLTDEVWSQFIKSIKWQFDGVEQKEAIPLLISEVEDLILQLPLPIKLDHASTYISILHYEIAQRTADPNKINSMLTNNLLDILVLNEGNDNDRWYADVYQKLIAVTKINDFNVGAFYEVINAARHCRWELNKSDHEMLLSRLLTLYIESPSTIDVFRRKAIYEYLFLLISPNTETYEPKGTIANQQELIRYYFNEFEYRHSFADLEEDILLLQIIQTHQLIDKDFLEENEIQNWIQKIELLVDEKITHPRDSDELCLAYELKGHFSFHLNPSIPVKKKIEAAIVSYKEIIPHLKQGKRYSISRLSEQSNQILNMLIRLNVEEEAIEQLENFLNEIEEVAVKTGQQHNAAQNLVIRGSTYLQSPSAKNYLKALDCFNKAKNLWDLNETKVGFILTLINIAQIYSALGMNLAAKYYGLCGVWASTHFGDHATFNRISDSYSLIFHADFKQGAWISALDDFEKYISARIEFNPNNLDMSEDLTFRNALLDLACILAAATAIHPDVAVFIEHQKATMGCLYTDHVKDISDNLTKRFQDQAFMKRLLGGN